MTSTLFDLHNPELAADYETVFGQHAREVAQEAARLDSAKARILARLREGPATNVELADICLRYTGRMSDLRLHHGCAIEKAHVGGGVWRYTLTGESA